LPALAESIGVAILVVVLIAACAWLVGRLSGRPALGMGDLKLYVVLVLFLDPDATFALLAVSAAAGLVLALIYRFVLREDSFPFAPAIVIGFVFALVNGGFMVVPLG
jgi:prepilin signal peptidase PulO-like enzyme (type II secretory pathway)